MCGNVWVIIPKVNPVWQLGGITTINVVHIILWSLKMKVPTTEPYLLATCIVANHYWLASWMTFGGRGASNYHFGEPRGVALHVKSFGFKKTIFRSKGKMMYNLASNCREVFVYLCDRWSSSVVSGVVTLSWKVRNLSLGMYRWYVTGIVLTLKQMKLACP